MLTSQQLQLSHIQSSQQTRSCPHQQLNWIPHQPSQQVNGSTTKVTAWLDPHSGAQTYSPRPKPACHWTHRQQPIPNGSSSTNLPHGKCSCPSSPISRQEAFATRIHMPELPLQRDAPLLDEASLLASATTTATAVRSSRDHHGQVEEMEVETHEKLTNHTKKEIHAGTMIPGQCQQVLPSKVVQSRKRRMMVARQSLDHVASPRLNTTEQDRIRARSSQSTLNNQSRVLRTLL